MATRSNSRCSLRVGVIGIIVTICVIILIISLIAAYTAIKRKEDTHIWKGQGTTQNLQDIVLGRCYNYVTMNPGIGKKNCDAIWQALTGAVYKKNPCNITQEDYKPLADLALQTIPCNKTLLWSKTNSLVHRYTKASQDFLTLEDTFLGSMFDSLMWCGMSYSSEMNYDSCPAWNECDNNAISAFWKMASATFAKASCGVVNVMLNGSADGGVARKESILRTVEVPSMNVNAVSEVRLWIIDDLEGPDKNSCDTESAVELKDYIEQHKLPFSCIDNYRPVQLLQCIETPDLPACKLCKS
uniref:ADP-ribosyl cyclase/cyclic ADP-ribose hydrolase 1 n=1 Tax=Xenopus laevis TaxID=8355 RepID=H7C831_XENLA|nr:CD38 molecule b [Xenopus laevis]BAL72803.1 CD38 [Xenopus laevis]BAL72804.1 CD38 [Xenopus laevis]